jgi:hypothetical protein
VGLVLAIPVTTLIAVLVVKATGLRRLAAVGAAASQPAHDDGNLRELETAAESADAFESFDTGELAAVVMTRRARREAERRQTE